MAGVSVVPAEILLSRRVQEMVLHGEEPLGPYVCRDGEDHLQDDSPDVDFSSSPVPIIDLSLLSSLNSSSKGQAEELERLKSALSSWGCFQAVGHGISDDLMDKIREVSREFFERPMEEKNKYAKAVEEFQGYGADPTPEEGQSLDWSDRLCLDVYPESGRNYRLWPENPTSFRPVLEEYTEKIKVVTEITSKAMAKSLNLDENSFLKQFGEEGPLLARFNYYSPCNRPDLVLGLKPHSDGSGYTIILQDEVGLQIRKDERWFIVPKNPHALLVLMGEQMTLMTNGILKSPVHRVLSSSERDRISVAMFYGPEVAKEIGPEEGLITEDRPKLYKRVKDYADIHWGFYQRGMGALHAMRI